MAEVTSSLAAGGGAGSASLARTQIGWAQAAARSGPVVFFAAVVLVVAVAPIALGAGGWVTRLVHTVTFWLLSAAIVRVYWPFAPTFIRFVLKHPTLGAVPVVLLALVYGQVGTSNGVPSLFWNEYGDTWFFSAVGATLVVALLMTAVYYTDGRVDQRLNDLYTTFVYDGDPARRAPSGPGRSRRSGGSLALAPVDLEEEPAGQGRGPVQPEHQQAPRLHRGARLPADLVTAGPGGAPRVLHVAPPGGADPGRPDPLALVGPLPAGAGRLVVRLQVRPHRDPQGRRPGPRASRRRGREPQGGRREGARPHPRLACLGVRAGPLGGGRPLGRLVVRVGDLVARASLPQTHGPLPHARPEGAGPDRFDRPRRREADPQAEAACRPGEETFSGQDPRPRAAAPAQLDDEIRGLEEQASAAFDEWEKSLGEYDSQRPKTLHWQELDRLLHLEDTMALVVARREALLARIEHEVGHAPPRAANPWDWIKAQTGIEEARKAMDEALLRLRTSRTRLSVYVFLFLATLVYALMVVYFWWINPPRVGGLRLLGFLVLATAPIPGLFYTGKVTIPVLRIDVAKRFLISVALIVLLALSSSNPYKLRFPHLDGANPQGFWDRRPLVKLDDAIASYNADPRPEHFAPEFPRPAGCAAPPARRQLRSAQSLEDPRQGRRRGQREEAEARGAGRQRRRHPLGLLDRLCPLGPRRRVSAADRPRQGSGRHVPGVPRPRPVDRRGVGRDGRGRLLRGVERGGRRRRVRPTRPTGPRPSR